MSSELAAALAQVPRVRLAALPTAIHPLERLSIALGGPEIWVKRDDLTGLAGGGNKTRKLEFLVADAIACGADVLVTVGAIQSNHTRQTAAAAARSGLDCVLLHNAWAPAPGPHYRDVGNVLFSGVLGAQLLEDPVPRHIDDQGRLGEVVGYLRDQGRIPYLIPGGGSEHPLGGMGYASCAAEILEQSVQQNIAFDAIVHCTGSSSTQAGLLAGLAALESHVGVIGVADDDEREDKCERVLRQANATLERLGLAQRVPATAVEVHIADGRPYGDPGSGIFEAIGLLAQTEGIIADPVYEGRAVRGLIDMISAGRLTSEHRVLLMHLGGTPALHAWGERIPRRMLQALPFD